MKPGTPLAVEMVALFSMGSVTANENPVPAGSILHDGTRVKTGPASMLELQTRAMDGGMLIRVQENSEFVVSAREKERAKGFRGKLESGEVVVKSSKLDQKTKFLVQTPTACASVRGTSYRVTFNGKETLVDVEEGMVGVRPALGIDRLPGAVREMSPTIVEIFKKLDQLETAVEAGHRLQLDRDTGSLIEERSPELASAMKDPVVLALLGKKDASESDATKAVQAFESHFPSTETRNRLMSVISGVVHEFPPKVSPVPEAELQSLSEDLEGFNGLPPEVIKSDNFQEAVEDRNRANREQIMKRISKSMNRPVQTLLLTNGQRVTGVILSQGTSYIVITPEGRTTYKAEMVDSVEF